MPPKVYLTGQVFGRLTVVEQASNRNGRTRWLCQCVCGNTAIVYTKTLRNGSTRSCGCLHVDAARAKGLAQQKPIGHRRIKKQNGRIQIKTEDGYMFEHTLVMETHIGRKLAKGEVVHHIDGDIHNNDISNLQLLTIAQHTILHHTGAKRGASTIAAIKAAASKRVKMQGLKLSREDAKAIAGSDLPTSVLAKKYNVGRSHIHHIKKGRTWRDKTNG